MICERVIAGVLEGVPAAFEENPLLRVDQLGLFRIDAEKGGVELIRVRNDGAGHHVVGPRGERSRVLDIEFVRPRSA